MDGAAPSNISISRSEFNIVCYYTLAISGQPHPALLDPYLCTHIIVGFAQVKNSTISPNYDNETKVYSRVIGLKLLNPSLKVLLSVGGPSDIGGFETVVLSDQSRTKFVNDSLCFIEKYGFDGLDIDWEFPSWPISQPQQRKNFTLLLKEFSDAIKRSNHSILLTVAVAAPEAIILQSYDVAEMAKYVDFVNLMAYDFHMYTDVLPVTGPNSPLFSRPADAGYMKTLNTNWSAYEWISLGMPKEKLVVGVPTFGHSFTLVNEDNNGWNAPAAGYGKIGSQGFVTYSDACLFISRPSTTHVFDDDYKVPYAFSGQEWISYENDESVLMKAYYIKENRFGGVMIFSLNVDDYRGNCNGQQFSLTRKISNILSMS
ncbi:hypothetical protein AAG570_002439 [Ranatra chinensis]|uniref:GH18 domain-containing protein n=1 Tax=Ranatra chinensis TaxID=642074 RepID=A0ABD0Y8I3_9HEMI